MRDRWLRPLAWASFAGVLAVMVFYLVVVIRRGSGSDIADGLVLMMLPVVTAISALLIITPRPRNPIGWLLMIWAVGTAASGALDAHLSSMAAPPAEVGLGTLLELWFQGWSWVLFIFPIFHLLLVFPTGRVPTPRWRWLVALEVAMFAIFLALTALSDRLGPGEGTALSDWTVKNPIGFITEDFWDNLFGVPWTVGLLVLTLGGAAASIVRYRRAQSEERQQLKWLVYAVAIFAVVYSFSALTSDWVLPGFVSVLFFLSIAAIPVAIAVAVLRFRLYDIDVVISRTLVYGALALFITGVYIAVVVGIGRLLGSGDQHHTLLSIAATALVAIAFQPVRRRFQQVANRAVYGRRATPYEVLSAFSQGLSAVDSGTLTQIARSLAEGTTATAASIWLDHGGSRRALASWPEGDLVRPDENGISSQVGQDGEMLGEVVLRVEQGQPFSEADRRLLDQVASGLGLAFRNLLLTEDLKGRVEELTASRRRIVASRDETRRKLERDLHDGAQQRLVALKIKLGIGAAMAEKAGGIETKALLDEIRGEADQTIERVREFAQGIFPPLLEAEGLAVALESQARRLPLPVSVQVLDLGRYSKELEATVYFCVLEAMHNAAAHARAKSVQVLVADSGDEITFEVRDDGFGFDPGRSTRSGLTHMADRLEAMDGSLLVDSSPGHGTRVLGRIPASELVTT